MLELKNISKTFQQHHIIQNLSITFPDTGFIGIQGESGCGKSTLLYIIGMLDNDYQGNIFYQGERIENRESFIRNHISFMMQNKDVISALTVKENIELACQASGKTYTKTQFKKITSQLGLTSYLNEYPNSLSGGQLKRVSIAKALLKKSSIVLCDEPTGALYLQQAHEVMYSLKKLSQQCLVIIVSHDPVLLEQYCDSLLTLKDGQLIGKVHTAIDCELSNVHSHYYPLWYYPIRQLLFQKNKFIFLFLFQWIIILSFFTIVTALNGVFDAIEKSEIQSVNINILQIEKKDGTLFESMIQSDSILNCSYDYSLNQVQLTNQQKEVNASLSFLPVQTSHIQLQQGHLPQQSHEVIISEALYQTLENKEIIHLSYADDQIDLSIVGVLSPQLFSNHEVYFHEGLKDHLSFLMNQYICIVETKESKNRDVLEALQSQYFVYSDVLERVDNYQSLLTLARYVAYVFVGISFFVSLLLIGIVESIILYERKHDVAYMLSLGFGKRRLFLLSIVETLFLGLMMGLGGSLISYVFYDYITNVYQLRKYIHFDLLLRKIFFNEYDLFVVICFIYMVMTIIGALLPIRKMMSINMIDVLREE